MERRKDLPIIDSFFLVRMRVPLCLAMPRTFKESLMEPSRPSPPRPQRRRSDARHLAVTDGPSGHRIDAHRETSQAVPVEALGGDPGVGVKDARPKGRKLSPASCFFMVSSVKNLWRKSEPQNVLSIASFTILTVG